MLVLTRKVGEVIHIGEYTVSVVSVSGRRVRLGVTAPKEVPVYRGELADLFKHGYKPKEVRSAESRATNKAEDHNGSGPDLAAG